MAPGSVQVRTDFKHLEDMTRAIDELSAAATVAVVELVAARPGQGVSSMFEFGRMAGVAIGSLQSNGFSAFDTRRKKLIEVSPQKWQRYFRKLAGELPIASGRWAPFDSVARAKEYLVGIDEYLTRVKDHNTADALLMAVWYICTCPEIGSLRQRDAMRLPWLRERFNT
jgi:crossover junction endodeoxyribonuclease RuvC